MRGWEVLVDLFTFVLFMFRGGAYCSRGGFLKFPEHFIFPQMYRGEDESPGLLTCPSALWPPCPRSLDTCSIHSIKRRGRVCVCVHVHACMSFIHDCISGCLWTHDLASASLVLGLQCQPDWRSLLDRRTPPHTHIRTHACLSLF